MVKAGNLALVAAISMLAGAIPAWARTVEVAINAPAKAEYTVSINTKINGAGKGELGLQKASGQAESVTDGPVSAKGASILQLELPDDSFIFDRCIELKRDGSSGYFRVQAKGSNLRVEGVKESHKKINATVARNAITLK
jgi:hypothetical protein